MSFTWGPLSGGAHLLLTPAGGSTGYAYYLLLRRLQDMALFVMSDSTASRRRFYLYLVDATDGITPETGEAAGQPQVSKAGGAWANTTATLTAVGNGAYYVELSTTELNTLGALAVRYKSANTAEFLGTATVINSDVMTQPGVSVEEWLGVGVEAAGGGTGGAIPAYIPTGNIAAASFAAGAIDAAAIASDAFTSFELASSATSEIATAVWGAARASNTTVGSFGEGVASVVGSVGSVATDGITAASIAADAIGSSELAATAVAEIADAVWDELLSGHVTAGSTGETLASLPTVTDIDTTLGTAHGTGSWEDAGGLTAATVADAVWDELMSGHVVSGSFGEGLQTLEDAVLIWPTPVGGGTAASTLIERAMAIADVHDNFVSETEWLNWLNQEQYSLQLFLARSGWALPFDTTVATIGTDEWSLATDGAAATDVATTAAGHYVFTPTLADVMAVVCIHESTSSGLRRLTYNDNVSFQKQLVGSTNVTGHATEYRLRMYGNELHADFYPTPSSGEVYLITYLSAPVALTTTAQAIAWPMGWEERIVLGMAKRALIKEESDPGQIVGLIKEMDSEIEQLCWNRVMSESPHVRNSDRNRVLDMPSWQSWYWR